MSIMLSNNQSQSLSPIHSYGYAYITSNQFQFAIDYFKSLINQNPNDSLSYQGISIALAKQEKIEDAITSLSKAIEIEPNCPSYYFFQSIFYQKTNQNYYALLSVKKGLAIDPNNKIGIELLEKISRTNGNLSDKNIFYPLLWSNENSPISLNNIILKDNMVYWSQGKPEFTEPSCINITLPVDNFNKNNKNLPPFPDYLELEPSQRAYYLNWLHSGRSEPLSDNGYLFLYLFGLERRVLLDEKDDFMILQECIRLKRAYPSMTSFFSYISSYIGYLLCKNISKITYSDIKEWYNTTDIIGPNELRVLLLWYVENNKPIPVNIAYHIVDYFYNEFNNLEKKDIKIKRDLFFAVFARVYSKGFSVQPSRQKFNLIYNPSNPFLKANKTHKDQYQQNLSQSLLSRKGQFIPLINLWKEVLKIDSIKEIDTIFKNSDLFLDNAQNKKNLKPKTSDAVWEALLSQKNIEEKNGSVILGMDILKPLISLLESNSLKSSQNTALQSFIKNHGFEVVPNIDDKFYSNIKSIGIIRKHPSIFHSNIYDIATFFLEIGMYIIHADLKVELKEIEYLTKFFSRNFPLNPFDCDCITIYKQILIENPPNPEKIKEIIRNIKREDQKITVASFIIDIILADNQIDKSEIDSLILILNWMEFSRSMADSIIQNRIIEMSLKLESELIDQDHLEKLGLFSEKNRDNISLERLMDNQICKETNDVLRIMNNIM